MILGHFVYIYDVKQVHTLAHSHYSKLMVKLVTCASDSDTSKCSKCVLRLRALTRKGGSICLNKVTFIRSRAEPYREQWRCLAPFAIDVLGLRVQTGLCRH